MHEFYEDPQKRCPDFSAEARDGRLGEDALDRVIDCFAKRLRSYAKAYCGNATLGLDAFQDAIMVVIENLHTYRGDSPIEPWMRRIVMSACNRYRRGKKNDPSLHISGDKVEASPELQATGVQETQAFLAQQLARLARLLEDEPSINVDLLLARDLDGDSIASLASHFSMTEQGVKSRLKRTRKRLRERLGDFVEN